MFQYCKITVCTVPSGLWHPLFDTLAPSDGKSWYSQIPNIIKEEDIFIFILCVYFVDLDLYVIIIFLSTYFS